MMPNKMPISIMDEKSEMLIKETPIRLSDQALNTIQLHTYEKAVKNVTKWHFYKLYTPFLSVAGTLAFSVFTSTFNSIGSPTFFTPKLFNVFIFDSSPESSANLYIVPLYLKYSACS